jgi:predicted short-subunit dehydrogenase-like oxidoreductase (DUF2520 family)
MHSTLQIAVVGAGRLGSALTGALPSPDRRVTGPHGRGYAGDGDDVVLLCVPDGEIAAAAACIRPGPLVGHCSGATGLELLVGHHGFSLHPLMTVTARGASFAGAAAAVDGTTPEALATATALAESLGMVAIRIAADRRPLYHAAASAASNFLVTLEVIAARLASGAGLERDHLLPLVRATVENWARDGAAALTGPAARRDELTLERQRDAVRAYAADVLPLWDALVDATRTL